MNNGQLNVVTAQPVIGSVQALAGQLVLSGTGGTANGTYYVLTSTNLASGNWTVLSTNQYDASGNLNNQRAWLWNRANGFFQLQQ